MKRLRPLLVLLFVAMFSAFVTPAMLGDIAVLGIKGPQSGTGFSNLGALSSENVLVAMRNAEVLIELESLKGDVLTAKCTAVFEMETDVNAPIEGQTLLVAFPLTVSADDVVKITDFELTVDGVQKAEIQPSSYLLSDEAINPSGIFWGGSPTSIEALVLDAQFGVLFGYRMRERFPADGPVISNAYAWQQTFVPGVKSLVEVKYRITLYAQSLAYTKEYLKAQSRDIVPFDLMLAGTSDEKAFFLDYVLRSGSTWKGPIGKEIVTLRAAQNSGILFDAAMAVTVGRRRFEGSAEDLRESTFKSRVGLSASGLTSQSDAIIWTIVNEDPQQDILVQIPASAVRNTAEQKD